MNFKVLVALSLLSTPIFAQYKTVIIPLENGDHPLRGEDFGDNGFVVASGNYAMENKVKTGYNAYYFKNNLDFDNETTVNQSLLIQSQYEGSVISLNGTYLYHIAQDTNDSRKFFGQDITQVNLKTKTQKKHLINKSKITGNIEFEFCDERYFYALGIGYEKDYNGKIIKGLPVYTLTKFKHDNFKKSEVTLQLPNTGFNNKTKSFWEYVGQDEKFVYMFRKKLQFKSGEHIYYFVTLNKTDGSISKQWSIPFSIRPKFILPSSNTSIDYRLGTLFYSGFPLFNDSYSRKSKGGDRRFYGPGSFGDAKLDFESGTIYIYGVYGNEKYNGEGSKYSGFYVYGYNFKGEKVFKTIQKFPEDLAREISALKEDLYSMKLVSLDVFDNYLELHFILVGDRRSNGRRKVLLSKTGEFLKMVTIKYSRNPKPVDHYKEIKEQTDNGNVLKFIKERETSKNDEVGRLTILKINQNYDILKEVKKDRIILYSFKK